MTGDTYDKPSQYGDGGSIIYNEDGEPVALLFAGGMDWDLPVKKGEEL